MNISTRYDAIIVGAGPAGSTAAYKLAEKGYKVLLIEKGRIPGSKNVYGGKIYTHFLKQVYPELEKEAPIHRWVGKERISFISNENGITFEYDAKKATSFTAYLSQMTEWMAKKAEQAGAILTTEVTVDKLVKENNEVIGIQAGKDKVFADTVIIAEGANRLVLEQSGLAPVLRPNQMALGVKEVIKLNKKTINERFNLDDNEGLSWLFLGDITEGLPDGGFLYTFNDTVAIGIVLHLGHAIGNIDKHVSQLVEKIRLHRIFRKYLHDGQIIEYGAHLTVEDPLGYAPTKYSGKSWMIIGDAAGFLANMGYTFRGVDFAAYSGMKAAEAFEKIREKGEDPEYFDRMIRNTPMYNELTKYRKVHELMENKRLFNTYPKMLDDVMSQIFHIEETVPIFWDALNKARKKHNVGLLTLLKDLYKMVKTI